MFSKVIASLALASVLHGQVALACDPVLKVTKGQPAPCDGFIFSPEKEQEVRIKLGEWEIQKTQIDLQLKKIDLLQLNNEYLDSIAKKEAEKAELWRGRAEESTVKLMASENGRGTRDWLFLGAGVLLTIGAGYAIGQAANK